MKVRVYSGPLTPQHPLCTSCGIKTYAMYFGGRKDKISNLFYCKRCNTLYKLPNRKRKDQIYLIQDIRSTTNIESKKLQGGSKN